MGTALAVLLLAAMAWLVSVPAWLVCCLLILAAYLAFFHSPALRADPMSPPVIQHPLGMPPVVDVRPKFRRVLSAVVDARLDTPDRRAVGEILHDLGEVPVAGEFALSERSDLPLAVILVSGVLWECVSDVALPFGSGQQGLPPEGSPDRSYLADYAYLQAAGVNAEVVEVARVQGIATSQRNATRVIDAIRRHGDGERPLVVIAYSKGVPDTLEALLQLGADVPVNLKAVVSVAGVVSGSPLGDWLDRYRHWIAKIPSPPTCPHVDENFLESITRRRCLPWLWDHWGAMPGHVGFYSLVTFERPQRMHWFLRLLHARLAAVEPRNDSHVTIQDQVFPGGKLLGYVQADHWSVTLPFNRSKRSIWNGLLRHNNAFPREILLESVLRYVEADLAGGHDIDPS